jgi:hypothetical protein
MVDSLEPEAFFIEFSDLFCVLPEDPSPPLARQVPPRRDSATEIRTLAKLWGRFGRDNR